MARLTVLGIGNILMRDEGVGVRLMEGLRDARPWPPDVEFVDGGVGGLNLLTVIEEAQELIVFDAAEMGLRPGESRVIVPEQVAQEDLSGRVSMHQVPFIETLALCETFFRRPPTTILAVQPASVEYGRELSEGMASAMPALVRAAEALVRDALERTGAR